MRTDKWLVTLVLGAVLAPTLGCGYVLYPERRGQLGGRLDPAVLIMDGLGLVLWVVPGVVAFAVDITSGTVYLPQRASADTGADTDADTGASVDHSIRAIPVADKAVLTDRQQLETLISRELGRDVDLDADDVRRERHGTNREARQLVEQAQREIDRQVDEPTRYAAR